MKNYIFKGEFSLSTQYKKDIAVKYNGSYYALKANSSIGNLPTDNSIWEALPLYSFESISEYNFSLQDYIDNGFDIADLKTNDNGLYMFPKKSYLDKSTDQSLLHFKLMGVEMIFEYAKAFYEDINNGPMPNITAIYIMQGERQENVICQGFSVATVSSVGFSSVFETWGQSNVNMMEFVDLGDGDTKLHFPWLDDSNKPLFPINTLTPRLTGNLFYTEISSISQVRVGNQESFLIGDSEDVGFIGEPKVLGNDNDLYRKPKNNAYPFPNDLDNLNTKFFGVFSPDLLMKNINPSSCFVKPIFNFNRQRSEVLTQNETENKYWMYTSCNIDSYREQSNVYNGNYSLHPNYIYNDNLSRILNHNKTIESFGDEVMSVVNEPTYHALCKIVNGNESNSTFFGFISRMKSIYEVYGEEDVPNSIVQFLNENRLNLMNAGIVLNRNKIDDSNINNKFPIIEEFLNKYTSFFKREVNQEPFNVNNRLPLVMTNLSMGCTPYLGVVFDNQMYYQNGKANQGVHNSIVNICNYSSLENYINSVIEKYNVIEEQYNIIADDNQWNKESVPLKIFKGDLFSQKTFMRINRWTSERQDYASTVYDGVNIKKNWDYGWKQGTAINVYLQSFVNTNLRVNSFDKSFIPNLYGNIDKGKNTITKDFVWKSSAHNYLNESWDKNTGYERLYGVFKLPAFDELQLNVSNNKNNRIYFSNKHISGAFIDQYRQIPIGQYQDFGFENGDIYKLIKYNSSLFSIQYSAINQHFSSQGLQSNNDSSEIILGNKEILSSQLKQLADFGTQHKESVVNGDFGVYGIDWIKEKIWRIKPSSTTSGSVVFGIEELETMKSLPDIFRTLKSTLNASDNSLPQDLYGETEYGIHSVFDELNKQVLFTFKLGLNKYYTLAFSEEFDCFTGYYSYNKNIYIKFNKRLLSFTKGNTNLWEHNKGLYQKIDGIIQPFVIEFIINGTSKEQNVGQFEKEFLSHIMNSCPLSMDKIKWETEYQSSEKNPFINQSEFWSNPEYIEHNWNIPILPQTNVNKGPLGTTNFSTFEPSSKMRGQWIKVKITYTPSDDTEASIQYYIRSLITNFIISFN